MPGICGHMPGGTARLLHHGKLDGVEPSRGAKGLLPVTLSLIALALGTVAVVLAALAFTHGSGSARPNPLPPSHSKVAEPTVISMTLTVATQVLQNADLRVAVATTTSNNVPSGQLISQQPPPGTILDPGSTVTVTQSLGPNVPGNPLP